MLCNDTDAQPARKLHSHVRTTASTVLVKRKLRCEHFISRLITKQNLAHGNLYKLITRLNALGAQYAEDKTRNRLSLSLIVRSLVDD